MNQFSDFSLAPELLSAVADLGFETPTPVQQEVIPYLLGEEERDLIALAQTGTGKTAAFGLPLLSKMDAVDPATRGLVICPTRELCNQITGDMKTYARHLPSIRIVAVYGGASVSGQISALRRGAHIIVATPGRLVDLADRGVVDLSQIKVVVLDEADEMMDMGFQDELNAILDRTPTEKRTWIFSATLPGSIRGMTSRYLQNPHEIAIGRRNAGAENISHRCYRIREKDRKEALKRVVDHHPEIYGLIFCRTREETRQLAEELMKDGYNADALHGDLAQSERDKVMRRFKEKTLQLLVATDVAARGLDVDNISHVIHYRLPDSAESYTHRSGRTARAGKSGVSIAFVNMREERRRRDIEHGGGFKFEFELIPSGDDVCERQLLAHALKLLAAEIPEEEIGRFLPPVYKVLEGLDRDELIRRFLAMEFQRVFETSRKAQDLNPGNERPSGRDIDYKPRVRDEEMVKFAIDVGTRNGVPAGGILRLVCSAAGVKSNAIGRIDMRFATTNIDVRPEDADKVFKGVQGAMLDGKPVRIRYWEEGKAEGKPVGRKFADRKSMERKPSDRKPSDRKPADRKPSDRKPSRPDSFGGKREKPTRDEGGFAGKRPSKTRADGSFKPKKKPHRKGKPVGKPERAGRKPRKPGPKA